MVLGERKIVADSVPGNNGRNYVHVTAIAQVLAIKQQYEFTRDLRLYAKKKGFDDQSIISGEKSKLILGTTNVKARQVFVDIELLRAWLADVREPKRLDNEKAVDVMSKITVISQKKKKSVVAATLRTFWSDKTVFETVAQVNLDTHQVSVVKGRKNKAFTIGDVFSATLDKVEVAVGAQSYPVVEKGDYVEDGYTFWC